MALLHRPRRHLHRHRRPPAQRHPHHPKAPVEEHHDQDPTLQAIHTLLDLPPQAPIPAETIPSLRLGTTVATNALLERAGEPTAFVTTKGFGDALRIGYQNRPDLFARHIVLPAPLYDTVVEIDERMGAHGDVVRPLGEAQARQALEHAKEQGSTSADTALLHGYRYPDHQRALARIAEEVGFNHVSTSHDVAPLMTLVSRGNTSVVDATLAPLLHRYIEGRQKRAASTPAYSSCNPTAATQRDDCSRTPYPLPRTPLEEDPMLHRSIPRIAAFALPLLVLTASPHAQAPWTWPEEPENLQVLPSEWSGERLRPVMTGFTRALGVRCSHCHVGEEGEPLSSYDFVSDENPNKDRAREMLRMLGSINDHLQEIEPSGDERVNMWCHTCHRGRPRPMTIGEELHEQRRASGANAVVEHYRMLKASYFGLGAYRFDEAALNEVGYAVLESGDTEGAIRIFALNTEEYPSSANVWDSLGEAHMKHGNLDEARRHYARSLELDPSNTHAADMLEQLDR